MFHWLHRILRPHCDRCLEEKREKDKCSTCEVLQSQLELANSEKKLLLTTIKEMNSPTPIVRPEIPADIKPIITNVSWQIRKRELEAESREEARLLRAKAKELGGKDDGEVSKLEKELGVADGSK